MLKIGLFIRRSMAQKLDLSAFRTPYRSEAETFGPVDIKCKDPITLFKLWLEEAIKSDQVYEANAMVLSTCSSSGLPSLRYVLLKGLDERGFHFFTNYNSRKAAELEENPHAALLFYWEPLKRQVRIEGTVTRLSAEENDRYFASRPKKSQISATVSPQSKVVPSREYLETKFTELEKLYPDEEKVPRPENWGGYAVLPLRMEFWQGQTTRLHDRILFRRLSPGEVVDPSCTFTGENGWVYERLAP
ncbi:unnamed protein product [Calicophoron daubneyi]|uniref:pyridoxal 5'-phosphate synthase n=1 Tax=Calicophoron daubneyi TaxID=300641 RepID=A0AAV2TL51_CALDB